MVTLLGVLIYGAGIISGIVIVRYGIGLGFKAIMQAKEDMPLGGSAEPIEQEYTSEDLEG